MGPVAALQGFAPGGIGPRRVAASAWTGRLAVIRPDAGTDVRRHGAGDPAALPRGATARGRSSVAWPHFAGRHPSSATHHRNAIGGVTRRWITGSSMRYLTISHPSGGHEIVIHRRSMAAASPVRRDDHCERRARWPWASCSASIRLGERSGLQASCTPDPVSACMTVRGACAMREAAGLEPPPGLARSPSA